MNEPKIKVYYNSACPVCKAGIEGQKLKDASCDIQWNDVHQNNHAIVDVDAELEFVRERLHVIDEQGKLQVGFDAFLTIWQNTPKETWKSKLLGLPAIKQIAHVAYNIFAKALYRWNKSKGHW